MFFARRRKGSKPRISSTAFSDKSIRWKSFEIVLEQNKRLTRRQIQTLKRRRTLIFQFHFFFKHSKFHVFRHDDQLFSLWTPGNWKIRWESFSRWENRIFVIFVFKLEEFWRSGVKTPRRWNFFWVGSNLIVVTWPELSMNAKSSGIDGFQTNWRRKFWG